MSLDMKALVAKLNRTSVTVGHDGTGFTYRFDLPDAGSPASPA